MKAKLVLSDQMPLTRDGHAVFDGRRSTGNMGAPVANRTTANAAHRYRNREPFSIFVYDGEWRHAPMQPIVRVSILRCPPDRFGEMRQMMIEDEKALRPGIETMRGLLAFYVGEDETTSSLMNVSLWTDLDAAKQLDRFQPMLDAGKPYVAKGATFERPIMNYTTLWQLKPVSKN